MQIFQLLAAALLPTLSLAYSVNGSVYCEDPYALCAGADCTMSAAHPNHATCTCTPRYGLNSGPSSCAGRATSLLSTYSIAQPFPNGTQPALYSFPCTSSNAGSFAECINAPCTVGHDNTATCTCKLSSGANHYLGPNCPSSTSETASLCAKLRSSSSSTTAPSNSVLPQFYGTAPDQPTCNAPGS